MNTNVTNIEPKTNQNRSADVHVAQALATSLADTYQAFLTTQNYHWNIEGRMFKPLHDLFEDQYREMFTAVDDIAERIRTAGYYAPGTFEEFAKISTVPSLTGTRDGETMVRNLVRVHEQVVVSLKRTAGLARKNDDFATEDLVISRIRVHEKMAWMLRSIVGGQAHLETMPN